MADEIVVDETKQNEQAEESRQPTDREIAMDQIGELRMKSFLENAGAAQAEATTAQIEAQTAAPEEKEEKEEKEADPERPIPLDKDLNRYTVKAKVDGEEVDVSLEEVLRQYQKGSAADKRLAEATRLLKEANEAQTRIQQQKEPEPEPEKPAPDDNSAMEEFMGALVEGDTTKAWKAFDKAMAGRQREAPTPDMSRLIGEITPAVRQQLATDAALMKFKQDYGDIVEDPYLAGKADAFLSAELEQGASFEDALVKAGNATRDWLSEKAGAPKQDTPSTLTRTEKLARKTTIETIPSVSAKAATFEEKPQSASEIIAEMRKARGLAD